MFINFFLSVVCSLILEIVVAKFLILDFFADFINNNQDINMNKLGALNWKIAGQSAMHEVSNFVQKDWIMNSGILFKSQSLERNSRN